jgi:hypothetical protein
MAASIRRLFVSLAAASLFVGCTSREPAEQPASVEGESGSPTENSADETTNEPAETVDPAEVMMMPARLTVNADEAGAVYIDGRRMADSTPLETAEVSPGRHRVQIGWDDGALLSDPRPALLRSDGNVILYVRRGEVVRAQSDPGIVRTEDELAEIDARLTAERAEAATEGSGETPDGGSEATTDATAEASNEAPDGSGDSATDEMAELTGETPEGSGEGSDGESADEDRGGEDNGGDVTPEGSGDIEDDAADEPVGTGYLRIDADVVGTLYVDGHRTDLTTPIILERPAGEVGIQVMYESGELSRHVDVAIADQRLRQVRFEGRELVVIR